MSTDVSIGPIRTAKADNRNGEMSSAYPNLGVAILALFGREWQWLVIGAIYLLGWYTPFTDHGSAGDGPLRWCWETWGTLRYSFGFQPYVPLAVGVVLWARREEIHRFWRTRVASKFSPEHPRRRGNLIPLVIGCLLLVIAHLVQVKGVGVGAMIVVTYGIAYRMYGPMMLRGPLFWPLALIWLIMPTMLPTLSATAGWTMSWSKFPLRFFPFFTFLPLLLAHSWNCAGTASRSTRSSALART
jgi:hypothetical protein